MAVQEPSGHGSHLQPWLHHISSLTRERQQDVKKERSRIEGLTPEGSQGQEPAVCVLGGDAGSNMVQMVPCARGGDKGDSSSEVRQQLGDSRNCLDSD